MEGFEDLWASLEAGPERLALVVGDDADGLVKAAASWRGIVPTSVSHLLTVEHPDGWEHEEQLLRSRRVLIDVEVLFWPTVMVDPLRLFRSLSRRGPMIVRWPGQIGGERRALFSEPGRMDYYDEPLNGEVVVRSRAISSPTDVPYDLEIAT